MEEFNSRLRDDAKSLFETQLPTLCRRFHDLLASELFNDKVVEMVKQAVRSSCQKLVQEKRQKLKDSAEKHHVNSNDSSDNEEFHTPMNSDSELDVREPPAKRLKKVSAKRKITKSDADASDKSDSDVDTDTDAILECNPHICSMMEVLKPELRQVTECCNTVRAWVQLQVPAMQDGNNFGVEVQGDMIEEIRRVEAESGAFLQALSLYHLTRADLASKFAKNIGVCDYQRAIEELDVKEVVSLRLIAREVRNSCVTLLDTVVKNMDKVVCPRVHNENMLVC